MQKLSGMKLSKFGPFGAGSSKMAVHAEFLQLHTTQFLNQNTLFATHCFKTFLCIALNALIIAKGRHKQNTSGYLYDYFVILYYCTPGLCAG